MTDVSRVLLEREAVIRQELARRGVDDPLRPDRPHPGQRPFIENVLLRKSPESWFIAANRTGKSDAGAFCGAVMARFGDDRARFVGARGSSVEVRDRATAGWVSSLDFPMSRDVIEPKYFDNGHRPPNAPASFIPAHEIRKWDSEARILHLKNGSLVGFKSADSGRQKYQGTDREWVHLDEEHPYDIYKEIGIRIGSRPLTFFSTMTLLPPEGAKRHGPSWVYNIIYKPWSLGMLPHIQVFQCSIYQNPHLNPQEIEVLEARFPEGSIDRRIRLQGEILPGMGGTRAYGNFESSLHVRSQPEYNPLMPLCWCWDFNVEPMCSIVGQREMKWGQPIFRVFKELLIETGSIDEMVELFWDTVPKGFRQIHIYGDSTSRARSRQTGKTDYTLILNKSKDWGVPRRLFVPDMNPGVIDRINAVNGALLDEQKMSHVEIDPSCTELIADMEGVLRDPRGGIKKTYDRKDPYFYRTHMSDAFGYWIAYERPVLPMGRGGLVRRDAPIKIPSPSYSTHNSP